jgi:hypothetical protein
MSFNGLLPTENSLVVLECQGVLCEESYWGMGIRIRGAVERNVPGECRPLK